MARVIPDSDWFALQHAFAEWLVSVGIARWTTEVPDVARAPLIYLPGGKTIQPDLLVEVACDHSLLWIDSKGKSDVVPHHHDNDTPRTGLEWDVLAAYRQVEALTARPCLIAFIHIAQREVRYVAANSPLWQRGYKGGVNMAFVNYEPLDVLARWNGIPSSAEFALVTNAFLAVPKSVQLGMDGFESTGRRYVRKGYHGLPGRPPIGVKGFIQP